MEMAKSCSSLGWHLMKGEGSKSSSASTVGKVELNLELGKFQR